MFYANSKYPNTKIKEIVVVAGSNEKINEIPVAPCGACRQVISEYETKQNLESQYSLVIKLNFMLNY